MRLVALSEAARALGLPGRRVLVAVSGGVDSVVLLHGLAELAPKLGFELCVGHVNHGLRGAEADADERFVEVHAAKLDLGFASARVAPEALRVGQPSRTRPTLQEAARRARYAALERQRVAAAADAIATAHTADDQAETLLLRLLRGTGPDGLGGIPERSPDERILRPLLGVTRAEVLRFARARGLAWREDPSNAERRFARARLRADWLPGLAEAFNPQLVQSLADLAEAMRREAEWSEASEAREAERWLQPEGDGLVIPRRGFPELPPALQRRLARRALRALGAGRDVSRTHLLRMVSFLRTGRTGGRLELPGGIELRCERDRFRLGPSGGPAGAHDPTAC